MVYSIVMDRTLHCRLAEVRWVTGVSTAARAIPTLPTVVYWKQKMYYIKRHTLQFAFVFTKTYITKIFLC